MRKFLTLLGFDAVFALPMLLCYLLWDMRELDRGLITRGSLLTVTALSIIVGLPFRLFHHRLPPRVAVVYARALSVLAGVTLFSGWIGPSMLAIASAGPILMLAIGDYDSDEQTWFGLNAWYFAAFTLFSGFGIDRDAQVITNNVCGLVLIAIPLRKALRKISEYNEDVGVDIN